MKRNPLKFVQFSTVFISIFLLQAPLAHSQHIWTGSQSSVYEFAGNWNLASIPDLSTDVVIPTGTPNKPIVTTAGAQARTLELQDSLQVSAGGKLLVDADGLNGRLSGDGVHVDGIAQLLIDSAGILAVQNCDSIGILVNAELVNRGRIEIDQSGFGIVAGEFSQTTNFGEVIGTDLSVGGIQGVNGRFVNEFGGYSRVDAEVRMTYSGSSNQGVLVVSSSDSLVVESNNPEGILHNAGGGGTRVVNFAGGSVFDVPGATYWIGQRDTNWLNEKNWILHEIPDESSAVIIRDAPGVERPHVNADTAFCENLVLLGELFVKKGAVVLIDNATSNTGILIGDFGHLRLSGELKVLSLSDVGVSLEGGNCTLDRGSKMEIKGGSIGFKNNGGSVSNDGTIILNDFTSDYALSNLSGSMSNQTCGIVDIISEEGFEDAGNNFVNRGSIIVRGVVNSALTSNSGHIHNLGGATITLANNTGSLDSKPGNIYWSGCVDSSWQNGQNWSRNRAPVSADSVTIFDAIFDPVVSVATEPIRYLYTFAELTVKNGGVLNLDATPLIPTNGFAGENEGIIQIDSGGVINMSSDQLLTFATGDLYNFGEINCSLLSLNNFGDSVRNEGTFSFDECLIVNRQGGRLHNLGLITFQQGSGGISNSTSARFHNFGEIRLNMPLGNALHNTGNANFTNHSCASFSSNKGFLIEGGSVTNDGYIGYTSTNYNLSGGTYIDNGFQYDPNDILPDGVNTVVVGSSITHEQFKGDLDGDGETYCSGDLDDLCSITNPAQNVLVAADDGANSLRDAIRDACPGSVIYCYLQVNDTIGLDSSITIDKNLTIRSGNENRMVVDGTGGDFSLFKIRNSAAVKFRNFAFINGGGASTIGGGAIETSDDDNASNINRLEIIDCIFKDNTSSFRGGAIESVYCRTVIFNAVFKENESGTYGGAIQSSDSDLDLGNCLFHNNVSNAAGGAVDVLGGTVNISQGTFFGNSSDFGGALQFYGATSASVNNSIIFGNSGTTGPDISDDASGSQNVVSVFNSLVGDLADSGLFDGVNGNIVGDPLFMDPLMNDFRLGAGSPCFNSADANFIPNDSLDIDEDMNMGEKIGQDLIGIARVLDDRPDMGAYEQTNDHCEMSFRLQCGQVASGTNVYQSTEQESLPDCVSNANFNFVGSTWYRFSGTGDSVRISATSTGTNAELHVYSGGCNNFSCEGGAYSIHVMEEFVDVRTTPGAEYYVMLGHYTGETTIPGMMSYEIRLECVCGDQPLTFQQPNNFEGDDNLSLFTDNTISASNTIKAGASIIYDGGLGVNLSASFEVQQGAEFQALLGGCPESP